MKLEVACVVVEVQSWVVSVGQDEDVRNRDNLIASGAHEAKVIDSNGLTESGVLIDINQPVGQHREPLRIIGISLNSNNAIPLQFGNRTGLDIGWLRVGASDQVDFVGGVCDQVVVNTFESDVLGIEVDVEVAG